MCKIFSEDNATMLPFKLDTHDTGRGLTYNRYGGIHFGHHRYRCLRSFPRIYERILKKHVYTSNNSVELWITLFSTKEQNV